MSAHHIYDNAPLGSLIRYSDGTPKPPARFNKKIAAWQNRNDVARLVKKQPQRDRPTHTSPASITLHEGDFASGGVVVVTVLRTQSVDSDLRFEIVERPAVGAVRILQEHADAAELLHLAENRDAAERWLTQHRYSNVCLEDVTEDESQYGCRPGPCRLIRRPNYLILFIALSPAAEPGSVVSEKPYLTGEGETAGTD
jgi:hypothetical protein